MNVNADDAAELAGNLGVRYEFFTPYHEKFGHIANLDIAPGFTSQMQLLLRSAALISDIFACCTQASWIRRGGEEIGLQELS